MRRFRLSTLMLLIVIAALCVGLVVQDRRAVQSAKLSTTTTSHFLIERICPQFGLLANGGVSADRFLSTERWMSCNHSARCRGSRVPSRVGGRRSRG